MRTRSSSNLVGESSPNPTTSNPKHHNRRRSKQPFILEESPVCMMADQRTLAELLRAPTEGYAEAIVVPPILDEHFELKHNLINMMTSDQFFRLEKDNPHDHIHLLRACPYHGFTEFHQLNTFYNALKHDDQDSLKCAAGGNLLERRTGCVDDYQKQIQGPQFPKQIDCFSSDANSSSSPEIAKHTHAVNQQTSAVTTTMTAILKQFQATPPPASVKAVEEICVTCGGAHPYYQFVPLSELEKIKKMNEINIKSMQTQINNVKNELKNEMKTSIQASMSNQTNELKNMMGSFFQMNTTSTSGSRPLPSNTIANPKGNLKAITTRSCLVLDVPFVPMPPSFINLEEDEHVEETLMDPELAEYTIKVPLPLVQKAKPPSQRNYVVHQRDPGHPHIPYPLRMYKEKQQDKDEIKIHKFWQMFNQLHVNISFIDALILIPKYQKMLKSLLSNKEKLLEMANTPLNENCSAVILKKLPEKLRDLGKFLIPCGFSEPECKALADLDLTSPEVINTTSSSLDHLLEDPNNNLVDTIPEMFTDEHTLDYSSPPLYDDFDDDLIEPKSNTDDAYGDPFDSKEDKIKESKLLIDELDLPRSSDFFPSPEYDLFLCEDFSKVDALHSTNNEDKVFNLGVLIHENLYEVTVQVTLDKNVKKISISNASLILKDFNPPLYELPFHKEVPWSETLLSFSSKNEEKVFNPEILTSKGVHTSLLLELSHQDLKAFKVIKIFESLMKIFPCSYGEDIDAEKPKRRGGGGYRPDEVNISMEMPLKNAETMVNKKRKKEKIIDSEKQEEAANTNKENIAEVAEQKEPEKEEMTLKEYEKVFEEKRKV
nr:hypothetical protein [Tanacetum cinerariifolium]